ncbi:DNA-methyltransferase [Clostridium rectalis]|uniref:DNA-methyltransferase n=1 Tax=Clostridium rectalis TaxID=2040295 RepID=UPI000F63A1D1|nr:site-specific DNA-methyltransferase [Clostridium rectalis]
MEINKVVCMDNLDFMKQLSNESIDLIYGDILYATGRNFKDYKDLSYNKDEVYNFYIPRIKEIQRLLKETGTLALQMDYRISHWIRDICDIYFGYKNCINVVQWQYSSGGSSKHKLSQKNDEIIIYAKNPKKQKFNYMTEISYNRDYKPYRFKGVEEYQDKCGRWYTLVGMRCIWNIPMVGRTSSERLDYATQKPLKLMDRIRDLYTNEEDLIGDFFCGSGSMIESAKNGKRNYIGCDANERAVEITNSRLAS